MDEVNDHTSSDGFQPLFIKEEEGEKTENSLSHQRESNTSLPVVAHTGSDIKHSAIMMPYLQDMDELLKSCEELTGIPFSSNFTASYSETSHSQFNCCEEVKTENFAEALLPPNAYLSTSYIDTQMDEAETVEQLLQGRQSPSIAIASDIPQNATLRDETSLSTAGNKLSQSMVEYEGQLRGMLAMLESCMEETGMDFEPQDWAGDEGVEYVHISKNPHVYRGTTLVPIKQEDKTQPMQLECLVEQEMDESQDKDRMDRSSLGPLADVNGLSTSSSYGNNSMQSTEEDLEARHRFSEPRKPLGGTEMTKSEGEDIVINAFADKKPELKTDIKIDFGKNELEALGSQMENFISEVEQMVKKRRELLAEVLQLRGNQGQEKINWTSNEEATEMQIDSKVKEVMDVVKMEKEGRMEEREREIKILKEDRAEEDRKLWRVNLERQGLQDELRRLKRRLFTMVKDCARSQATLNNQRREVELLKREEEKLDQLVLQLTEESSQLRAGHQQLISDLQAKLQAQSSIQTPNTQEELSACRRHSCGDIQQYVQEGLRTLEQRYEPILLALMKRKETTADALVKVKENTQELKSQLRPLREEIQKLKLQRSCLEEKLKLIHIQRGEDVGQYKVS
uniref:Syncoilin-like n=1 Tax=Gouania willdenowi TaxID=441366 RepID=A0A8C5EKD2_GOUWI